MQRPIALRLQSSYRTVSKISKRFLQKVRYKVSYGEQELIRLKEGTIYSQRYGHYLFYIEMMEIKLTKDLKVNYWVKDSVMFQFFMLDGNTDFTKADGTLLIAANKGFCYLAFNKSGEMIAHFHKGTHRLFYFSIRPGWLRSQLDTYPNFRNLMASFDQGTDLYNYLPPHIITEGMRKFLRDLYKINPATARNLEVGIPCNCTGVLEIYHNVLLTAPSLKIESPREIITRLKAHLDAHFTDHDIADITRLAERYPLSERTIRRLFPAEFNQSIHEYIEVLRINHGHELLQSTNLSIREVAVRAGFKRQHYFTIVFKKHFGYLPKSLRNRS